MMTVTIVFSDLPIFAFPNFSMKVLSALVLSAVLAAAVPVEVAEHETAALEKRATLKGVDVSHYQGTINWSTVKSNGVSFAYIKATEGTSMSPDLQFYKWCYKR
jgi:GH25 family lysozyme M1 (1,4-beta-N-acetylmuramidase)